MRDDKPLSIAEYGQLPLLRESHHEGLQQELSRLISERATPALMTAGASGHRDATIAVTTSAVADRDNVAAGLGEVCSLQSLPLLEREVDKSFPAGAFQFPPEDLVNAIDVRKTFDAARLRYRSALERQRCDFGVKLTDGIATDVSFVKMARVGNRLESLMVAELLYLGRLDEAIDSLRLVFRMVALLAAEKHVVPRLAAAWQREDALRVLEAIAQHRDADRDTLGQLLEMVNGHLARWPPDADAWSADRAVGMHTYEIIRDGHMLSVLTPQEIVQLEEESSSEGLVELAMSSIDEDEYYYLQTMRRIVESCSRPYYERSKLFDEIRDHLQAARESSEFPIVAGRLLLTDIQPGHEIQARDRALCEAWSLALSAAIGRRSPLYKTSPLTGRGYRVAVTEKQVEVSGVLLQDDDWTIKLPRLIGQE